MTYQLRGPQRWHARGAALATALAFVAGSLAATTPAFASTTAPTSLAATTAHVSTQRLHGIKASAARLIRNRVHSLNATISVVQSKTFLGMDGATLVAGMRSDIKGLEALSAKIAADTTVKQAANDRDRVFNQFDVYGLVLPVVNDVINIDWTDNVALPSLERSIRHLRADMSSSNSGTLGPLVRSMRAHARAATSATSGLSARLLSYTPAQWNADHALLNIASSDIRKADRAIVLARRDLRRAGNYLRDHGGTTTTTSTTTAPPTTAPPTTAPPTTAPPTTTTRPTTTTTSTTTPTTTTTAVPGSNCSAWASGTVLGRTGWSASTNTQPASWDAPANALDGNMETRFSTDEHQAPGLYLKVDMRSAQAFDELEMVVPNSDRDYARGYRVELSNGSSWWTVANCTGTRTPEIVSFRPQTARYLAVVLTADDSTWWSVDELYVRTATAPPTTTTRPTTTTTRPTTTTTSTTTPSTTTTTVTSPDCSAVVSGTALSRTAWLATTNARPGSADAPAHALDGNMKTRFSTDKRQAAGLYLRIDMRSSQTFDQLEMDVPNSVHDYARGYDVETSTDGATWTTVATCSGARAPEVVSFPVQTARYVEVVLTTSSPRWWWSVDELYVRH
jgi:hypothetical protein